MRSRNSKSAARRRARVLEVLESSAAVEEIFADDEVLGVLVEEFG